MDVEQLTAWGARLDDAVLGVQALPPASREVAQEFALALDVVSRQALATIVQRMRADPRGKEILFELVDDAAVRMLLGMHGIIRLPDPEQAERTRGGLGADGKTLGSPASGTRSAKTFISLDALFRGPATTDGACGSDACGTDSSGADGSVAGSSAADSCGCGGHEAP